eukprot:GHVU01116706.1.p1 GENE.GHVU01116706.1~~GHVU01116706.1.p1  ORF type:complete len:166 (-),score=8.42 GHVU01116706.1:164-661(-)
MISHFCGNVYTLIRSVPPHIHPSSHLLEHSLASACASSLRVQTQLDARLRIRAGPLSPLGQYHSRASVILNVAAHVTASCTSTTSTSTAAAGRKDGMMIHAGRVRDCCGAVSKSPITRGNDLMHACVAWRAWVPPSLSTGLSAAADLICLGGGGHSSFLSAGLTD